MFEATDSGTVQLKSGHWRWSAVPTQDGFTLIFRHATRSRDEMKTWVEAGSSEGVLQAARDPVYRVWESSDGVLWLVGVEFASLQKDSPLWLTFKNAYREFHTIMPPDTSLGEMSVDELSRLLREAS